MTINRLSLLAALLISFTTASVSPLDQSHQSLNNSSVHGQFHKNVEFSEFSHPVQKREILNRLTSIHKNLTDNQTLIDSVLPPIFGRAVGLIFKKPNEKDDNSEDENAKDDNLKDEKSDDISKENPKDYSSKDDNPKDENSKNEHPTSTTKRPARTVRPRAKSLPKNNYANVAPIKRKRKFKVDIDQLNTQNAARSASNKSAPKSKGRMMRPIIKLDNLDSKDPFGLKKSSFANPADEEAHCYQQIELVTLPIRITSPNYRNGNYPSETNCIYNLTSAETSYKEQIKLNIISLELEDSKKCEHDFLQIQNSSIRFCGELKNKVFYLNQSSAVLNFRSDLITEYRGFEIEVSIENDFCKSRVPLIEHEQLITSPNFPNNYPDSMDCWTLIDGEKLQLEYGAKNQGYDDDLSVSFTFLELAMEPDSLCSIDYVELFEVDLTSMEPRASLGRFCEYGKYVRIVGDTKIKKNQLVTMGTQVHTRTPYLYMHFKSDKLINSRGFKAQIEVKEKAANKLNHTCDWQADGQNKKLISPSFPLPYPSNIDCSVLIEAPADDQFVLLTFERFILEPDINCSFDRFLIYEPQVPKIRSKRAPIGTQTGNVDLRRFLIGNQVIRASNQNKSAERSDNQAAGQAGGEAKGKQKSSDLLTRTLAYDQPSQAYCGKKESNSKYLSKGSKLVLRFVTDDFGEYLGFSINYQFVDAEDAKRLREQISEPAGRQTDKTEEKKKDDVEYELEPVDAEVTIGSSHILKCKPKGYSKLNLISNQFDEGNRSAAETIRWFKDNNEITSDLNEDKTVLLIREFHLSSTGSYKCKFGKSSRQAWLKMRQDPECAKNNILFQRRPQDVVSIEGDYPILECGAVSTSNPGEKLKIDWLHNGQPVKLDQRIQLLPNRHLLLGEVRKEDSGYYHCQITDQQNEKCRKTSIAFLQVRSKQNVEQFCGRPMLNKHRKDSVKEFGKIVGGSEAIRGQFPWQVMFYDVKRNSFCGGAVLNERWLSSAAHCFKPNPQSSSPPPPLSQIVVKLGKHDQNIKEEGEFSTSISEIYLHPQYNPETFDNDLALIQVKHHITFNEYIQPICLGTAELAERNFFDSSKGSSSLPPKMGHVSGWGQVRENGPSPRFLQQLQVPLVPFEDCKLSTTFKVTSNMFCAGYGQDTIGDSCKGDSGSPFTVKLDDSRFYLVGVVSWGIGEKSFEKSGKYGFYTKISNYLDWINALIQI